MHSLNKYCKFMTMKHVTGSVNGYPACVWILTCFLEIYIVITVPYREIYMVTIVDS